MSSAVNKWRSIPGNNMLYSFLNPGEAYGAAEDKANQGWKEAQDYQKPYWEHGNDQYDPLNQARSKLMDPAALQNEWSQGYETSPWAQRQLSANLNQGQEAASSMGLMGSSAALGNIQQGAGDIMAKDRQAYMNDMMQKYMAGIGLGQSLYGTGASAGANLGGQALSHGNDIAGLEYKRQAAPGRLLGQGLGAAANYYSGGLAGLATGGRSMYGQGNGGRGNYAPVEEGVPSYNSGRPGY